MYRKQNSLKVLILLFCCSFLIGCNTILESSVLQKVPNSTYEITIQTVEFSNHAAVTNVGVKLFDFNNGDELASDLVDNEGKVTFKGVHQKEPYEIAIFRVLPSGEWMEQTRETTVFDKDQPSVLIETFNPDGKTSLGVPVVKQNPELPNGCEITSLSAILNYYGLKVDKVNLANNYMPKQAITTKGNVKYGPDPNVAYAGDPSKKIGGYYVFAPPIVKVANQVLFEKNSEYRAMDLSDSTKKEIINYVQSGVPVLTWITIDYKQPRTNGYWMIPETNSKHQVYMNLHAVVMTGYQDGRVTIMNPLKGYETIDEKVFFDSFHSLGSHAIVIL